MPCDFPPWQTVYDILDGWQENGATEKMHDELRRQCRIAAGRCQRSDPAHFFIFIMEGSRNPCKSFSLAEREIGFIRRPRARAY
jgi:transposase